MLERAGTHLSEMDAAKAAHEDREELAKAAHVRALGEMDGRMRAALRELDETQRQVSLEIGRKIGREEEGGREGEKGRKGGGGVNKRSIELDQTQRQISLCHSPA